MIFTDVPPFNIAHTRGDTTFIRYLYNKDDADNRYYIRDNLIKVVYFMGIVEDAKSTLSNKFNIFFDRVEKSILSNNLKDLYELSDKVLSEFDFNNLISSRWNMLLTQYKEAPDISKDIKIKEESMDEDSPYKNMILKLCIHMYFLYNIPINIPIDPLSNTMYMNGISTGMNKSMSIYSVDTKLMAYHSELYIVYKNGDFRILSYIPSFIRDDVFIH